MSGELKTGTSATPPSRNLIGSVGAFFASTIFWSIGAAGYMFPILLGLMGARCFTQDNLSIRLRNAAASLAALLFLAGFLHLEVTGVPTVSSGLIQRGMAGGVFGRLLAESLRIYFASTGAHILIMAGLLVSLLFTTSISLAVMVQRIPGLGNSMFTRARALIPDRSVEASVPEPPRKAKQKSSKSIRAVIEEALPEAAAESELDWPVIQPSGRPTPEPAEPIESEAERMGSAVQGRAGDYSLPDPAMLLSEPSGPLGRVTEEEIKAQSDVLTRALLSFGIAGKVTEVRPGPVVTMYEFEPASGTKVARIVSLADDLALALKAISLRIVAPIPGKSVVGIEVPNLYRETVSMKAVMTSEAFSRARSKLSLALGKDIFGAP
ncbi:MAG: DNA translocase FtsK 4TM domain-containing protein, partial [Bryobacteraceae bacterium]